MTNQQGQKETNQTKINEIFRDFYAKLYTADAPQEDTIAKAFVDKIGLQTLMSTHLDRLNAPILNTEIEDTIKELATGKATGQDEFSPTFYKMFRDTLLPTLRQVYTTIWGGGPTLPTGKESYVEVLLQPPSNTTFPTFNRYFGCIKISRS